MNNLPQLTHEPEHHPDCCLSLSTKLLDVLTAIFAPKNAKDAETRLVLSVGSGTGLLEALLLDRWSAPQPQHPSGPDVHDGGPPIPTTATSTGVVMTIQGVEVHPSVNKHLPEANLCVVRGTWDVVPVATSTLRSRSFDPEKQPHPDAGAGSSPASADDHAPATGLLFVYPRSPALVSRYLRGFGAAAGEEEGCEGAAVWLGHRSDWPDFAPCFASVPGLDAVEVLGANDESGPDADSGGVDVGLVGYEMMAVVRRWSAP